MPLIQVKLNPVGATQEDRQHADYWGSLTHDQCVQETPRIGEKVIVTAMSTEAGHNVAVVVEEIIHQLEEKETILPLKIKASDYLEFLKDVRWIRADP